jgi:hypothetical protein
MIELSTQERDTPYRVHLTYARSKRRVAKNSPAGYLDHRRSPPPPTRVKCTPSDSSGGSRLAATDGSAPWLEREREGVRRPSRRRRNPEGKSRSLPLAHADIRAPPALTAPRLRCPKKISRPSSIYASHRPRHAQARLPRARRCQSRFGTLLAFLSSSVLCSSSLALLPKSGEDPSQSIALIGRGAIN